MATPPYQCSSGTCRYPFTGSTRTPLHATKLPVQTWMAGLWLLLQSDKGISSIRLAEVLGVSQPTAWRMGHALRLMVGREQALGGVIEIDSRTAARLIKRRLGLFRGSEPRLMQRLATVQLPNNTLVWEHLSDSRTE